MCVNAFTVLTPVDLASLYHCAGAVRSQRATWTLSIVSSAAGSRPSLVPTVADRDSHCTLVVLTCRRLAVPSPALARFPAAAAATPKLLVTPDRQPVAKRDLAVPVGFNNQWLSFNDRACLRARRARPGRPSRVTDRPGHLPPAALATTRSCDQSDKISADAYY